MKKIALIYHDADLVTLETFRALARSGDFEVLVLATAEFAGRYAQTLHGLEVAAIAPISGKMSMKAARDIRCTAKARGIQALFAVSTSALSAACMAATGTPMAVIGYRGTQARVHRFDPTFYLGLLNPRVDALLCETPDIEQYLRSYIAPRKLWMMPKPYDVAWVADALQQPVEYDPGVFNISYIGITKGRPHKGLHHLLEAVRLLQQQGRKVALTVVGEASEHDVEAAPPGVTFTGNRADAVRYLPNSQVFVLPSTRDASPRVVREAQACGVPCVVSDIAGARSLIISEGPGRSGILVPPADAAAIARAVATLMDNPGMRREMAVNARRNIEQNYRPEAYTRYVGRMLAQVTHL